MRPVVHLTSIVHLVVEGRHHLHHAGYCLPRMLSEYIERLSTQGALIVAHALSSKLAQTAG